MNQTKTANEERKSERYYALDKLKFTCSFLVVCIHSPISGLFGEYFMALTRVAIPLFFMISGFFYCHEKTIKHIRKILGYLIVSNVIYLIVHFISPHYMGLLMNILKNHFLYRSFYTSSFLMNHLFIYICGILEQLYTFMLLSMLFRKQFIMMTKYKKHYSLPFQYYWQVI